MTAGCSSMNNPKMILLERIRQERGFSKPQFAKIIGFTSQAITLWEAGTAKPYLRSKLKVHGRLFSKGLVGVNTTPTQLFEVEK